MGCGAQIQQQERLKNQKQKLKDLGQIKGEQAEQIADLRDIKNKRNPIYIIKRLGQVEELTSYKEGLKLMFQLIDIEFLKVNTQLQIQAQVELKQIRKSTSPINIDNVADEEEWKKAYQFIPKIEYGNDLTIQPCDDAQHEIESDNSQQTINSEC